MDDGRCSCMTEQGTRYAMDKKICRSIAANGVYNPYRRPALDAQQSPHSGAQVQPADAVTASSAAPEGRNSCRQQPAPSSDHQPGRTSSVISPRDAAF